VGSLLDVARRHLAELRQREPDTPPGPTAEPSPAWLRHVTTAEPCRLFQLAYDVTAPPEGRLAARRELHRRAAALDGPPPNSCLHAMLAEGHAAGGTGGGEENGEIHDRL
jgi:hypothetical protein